MTAPAAPAQTSALRPLHPLRETQASATADINAVSFWGVRLAGKQGVIT